MSTKGLANQVKIERGNSGVRLVDPERLRTLALSDTEASLLEVWGGSTDAEEVTRRAQEAGLPVTAGQVAVYLERLARAGFLAAEAVPAGAAGADLGLDAPTAIVPRVRGDLEVARVPDNANVVQIKDPRNQRSFTLYDFEASIARMLDGRRTVQEVLAGANRIGIPVTLDSLRKFIRQLQAYGFIDDAAEPSGEQTTWTRRKRWDPEVRALFQGALRMSRGGKADEALTYLDALAAVDPGNEEADLLRAQVQAQLAVARQVDLSFHDLHGGPAAPAPEAPPPAVAQPSTRLALAVLPEVPAPVSEAPRRAPARAPEPRAPAPSRPGWGRAAGLLAALGGLGVAGALLLRPVPFRVQAKAAIEAPTLARVVTPRAGTVAQVRAPNGGRVQQGEELATLETAQVGAEITRLEGQLEEARARIAALGEDPQAAKRIARLREKLAKRQAALDALEAARARALAQPRPRPKALASLDQKLAKARAAQARSEERLEVLSHAQARGEAQRLASGLEARLTLARAVLAQSSIRAPASGRLASPAMAPGQVLTEGAELGLIASATGQVSAAVDLAELPPGARATLDLGSERLPLRDLRLVVTPGGRSLSGLVELPDRALASQPWPLELDLGTRPYYASLRR